MGHWQRNAITANMMYTKKSLMNQLELPDIF